MAKARTSRKPVSKSVDFSGRQLFVFGVIAFLLSSVFEKFKVALADHIFAVIGLVLFVLAARKYFRK